MKAERSMIHLFAVAQTLRQIVDDLVDGIQSGLLREDLTQARKVGDGKGHIRNSGKTTANDREALDAANALRDGRAALLCEALAVLCPGAAVSPAFLASRAVQLSRKPGTTGRGSSVDLMPFIIGDDVEAPDEPRS